MYYCYFQLLFKYESTSHGNKKPVLHQSQYIQSVLKFEIWTEYEYFKNLLYISQKFYYFKLRTGRAKHV